MEGDAFPDEVDRLAARQPPCLGIGDPFLDHRLDGGGGAGILLRTEAMETASAQLLDKAPPVFVGFIPGPAMKRNEPGAGILDDLLEFRRKRLPAFAVHRHIHCGGVADGGDAGDVIYHLALLPALQGLHRTQRGLDHPLA